MIFKLSFESKFWIDELEKLGYDEEFTMNHMDEEYIKSYRVPSIGEKITFLNGPSFLNSLENMDDSTKRKITNMIQGEYSVVGIANYMEFGEATYEIEGVTVRLALEPISTNVAELELI